MSIERRFWNRLAAWVIANVAFYILFQRWGWVLTLAVSALVSSGRVLARMDFEKALEERDGLSK